MKDIKLIEALVTSYYHENIDEIRAEALEELLIDSLNIEINSVTIENNYISVSYGTRGEIKIILFEFRNNKIKIKK